MNKINFHQIEKLYSDVQKLKTMQNMRDRLDKVMEIPLDRLIYSEFEKVVLEIPNEVREAALAPILEFVDKFIIKERVKLLEQGVDFSKEDKQ